MHYRLPRSKVISANGGEAGGEDILVNKADGDIIGFRLSSCGPDSEADIPVTTSANPRQN